MRAIDPIGITVFTLLVGSLMMRPALSQSPQDHDNTPVLYGAKFDGSQIAVDVVSRGCADASYFAVQLDLASPNSFRLSILARRQDRCRMAAFIVTVTLDVPTVPNLPEARFILMNQFAVPNSLRRSDP